MYTPEVLINSNLNITFTILYLVQKSSFVSCRYLTTSSEFVCISAERLGNCIAIFTFDIRVSYVV